MALIWIAELDGGAMDRSIDWYEQQKIDPSGRAIKPEEDAYLWQESVLLRENLCRSQ